MEPGIKKSSIGAIPMLALTVSMVAFAIVAILLLLSVMALKSDNAALKTRMEALTTDLQTVQNAQIMTRTQGDTAAADIRDIKARTEALEALKAQMEQAQPQAEPDKGLSVASFDLKYFANAAANYQTYSGTGTIQAADAADSYLVLLQKTLKAGGAPSTKKMEYVLVLVVGGTGTFYTDDSAEGAVTKPEYGFTIVGSVRMQGNGAGS